MSIARRGRAWAYDFTRSGIRHTRSGLPSKRVAAQAEAVHKARLLDDRLQREYGLRPTRALSLPTKVRARVWAAITDLAQDLDTARARLRELQEG